MALHEGDIHNFETLLMAAKRNELALIESKCTKTGEYRAVLCAMWKDDEGMINCVPFGNLCTGNPYDAYEDPTKNTQAVRKVRVK